MQHLISRVMLPGRYTGGEAGTIRTDNPKGYHMAISFPDLYEIGMSNNAVRIIYNLCNTTPNIVCERVFAPAPDLEELLKEHSEPLRTLEFQRPLKELDLLAFTVGYELSATTILTILDRGQITLRAHERGEGEPVVIAGGPAMTNPLPLGPFFDGVYIGEAEEVFTKLITTLSRMKSEGATRAEMVSFLQNSPYIWHPGKETITQRAIYTDFPRSATPTYYPVPHIEAAQNHGVVEVMRGCPNGCRFCQAGYFYRPLREKEIPAIIREIDFLVYTCGYQQITLTSLSTGDYSLLQELFSIIHERYKDEKITFSLPSLKVNSFTLELMKELSKVKKSGLTFAVETPLELWQKGINKEVGIDKVIAILQEAKRLGWSQAKFYFMIGLPVANSVTEEVEAIISYVKQLRSAVKIGLNLNIGTFIPKPHTPYQWEPQLGRENGLILRELKEALKAPGIKISYHDPFVSYLEGVLARGDQRVTELIEAAYRAGARLDPWSEYFQRDTWNELFDARPELDTIITGKRDTQEPLPWSTIQIGPSIDYFEKELRGSNSGHLTAPCGIPCPSYCGVCTKDEPTQYAQGIDPIELPKKPNISIEEMQPVRIIGEFSKIGRSIFLSHINVMHLFERAILQIGAVPMYTRGFTPKPRIEFANPLSLGVYSEIEAISIYCYLPKHLSPEMVAEHFSQVLPEGLDMGKTIFLPGEHRENTKIVKLTPNYGGCTYEITAPSGEVTLVSTTSRGKEQPGNPLKKAIEASGLEKIEFLATHRVVRKELYFKLPEGLGTLFQLFG